MAKVRTPLRYPGGKQKVSPFIREILEINEINENYVEPFAGGSGVAIELLLSKNVKNIFINDIDFGIYAFWYSVVHFNEQLCRKIDQTTLSVQEWANRKEIVKNFQKYDLLEIGFSVFYLNRCNRSGILSAGLIGGQNQDGPYLMDARFNRKELVNRIETIGLFSSNIFLTNLDAEDFVTSNLKHVSSNTLIYFDPPYFNKSSKLYTNNYNELDHKRLSVTIQNNVNHLWVLSYDNVNQISSLYLNRRRMVYDLQYSAFNNYKGKELFAFCDELKIPINSSVSTIQTSLGIFKEIY